MMLDANTAASAPPPQAPARSSEATSPSAPSGRSRDDTPANDEKPDSTATPAADQPCNPQDDATETKADTNDDSAPAISDAVALLVPKQNTTETSVVAPDKDSSKAAAAVVTVSVVPPPLSSAPSGPQPAVATDLAVPPVVAPDPVQPPGATAPAPTGIAPAGGDLENATPAQDTPVPATPSQATASAAPVVPLGADKVSAGAPLAEAASKPGPADLVRAEPGDAKAKSGVESKAAKKIAATDGSPKPESPAAGAPEQSTSAATGATDDADIAEAKSAEPKRSDSGAHGKPVPPRAEASGSESGGGGGDTAAKTNGTSAQFVTQALTNPVGSDGVVAASSTDSGIEHADSDAAAVPVAGLAVEIAARVQNGRNRFDIRLDPPELGRIEVRLDVDKSGQVTSRLIVDRPETLDLLRRDAAGLERALHDAGLKTGDNGMQFSLRDQGLARQDDRRPAPTMANIFVPESDAGAREPSYYGRMPRAGGLDIRV